LNWIDGGKCGGRIDTYVRIGPKRIVFHLEAMHDKESFLQFLEE
jgi:hypothetical protein